jgi:hypothetical protein
MLRRGVGLLSCAAVMVACGATPEDTPFERSCRGERFLECDPYEFAVVREASLSPTEIRPLDPAARARVRAVVDSCPRRPGPVEVQLGALLDLDAGAVRFVDLGITVRDDGTHGDRIANDGVIESEIGNPFGGEIPGNTTIRLRWLPVISGCDGQVLEIPYTTGPRAALGP